MKGITFSLISGFFAATSSLCGKFSMATEETLLMCEFVYQKLYGVEQKENFSYSATCQNVILITRFGFFIAMLLSNALMWTLFTKALRMSSTTLEATITNTAANFFFTAVYGQVFFGETLTFFWWTGTMLIITGLLIMQRTGNEDESLTSKYDKKKR